MEEAKQDNQNEDLVYFMPVSPTKMFNFVKGALDTYNKEIDSRQKDMGDFREYFKNLFICNHAPSKKEN